MLKSNLSLRKFMLFNTLNFLLFGIVSLLMLLYNYGFAFLLAFSIGFVFGIISGAMFEIQNKVKNEKLIPLFSLIRLFSLFLGLCIATLCLYFLDYNFLYILLTGFEIIINYFIIIIIKWREV